MCEYIEIAESIYEGVVEHSYKKTTHADANPDGHSRKKSGGAASPWSRPENVESAGKRRKRHLDSPTGKSKTCLIHSPRYSSEEYNVLGDFRNKYANSRPTKNRGSSPVPRKTFNRQRENNTHINNSVDEILLIERQKVSATNHEEP